MSQFESIIRSAAEQLLEDEGARSNLTDDEASTLGKTRDEAAARQAAQAELKRLRPALQEINHQLTESEDSPSGLSATRAAPSAPPDRKKLLRSLIAQKVEAWSKKENTMDLTQLLMQQLAGGGLSQISQQLGADEQTTGSALSVAMPLLVSALANNASKPEGAQALHQALAEDHDGSILSNVPGFLSNPQAANGAGILGHVLGSQQPAVVQGLAQSTGLDSGQAGQLLQIAAPLLMGALGQQQQQQGLDPNGLSAFLGSQQQTAQHSNPDMMSMLNSLLDANKDGSGLDEALGLLGKLFSGQ